MQEDGKSPPIPVISVQIGGTAEPPERWKEWPGADLVREAPGLPPHFVPHAAVTSGVDLAMADTFRLDTPSLIRLGARCARQAASLSTCASTPPSPSVADLEWHPTPMGLRNAVRLRFEGVTGGWRATHNLNGFAAFISEPTDTDPLVGVNAWVNG